MPLVTVEAYTHNYLYTVRNSSITQLSVAHRSNRTLNTCFCSSKPVSDDSLRAGTNELQGCDVSAMSPTRSTAYPAILTELCQVLH